MPAITIYRGDSYPITFTIKNKETGAAIDLAGSTLKLTVDRKQNPGDNTTKLFECVGVLDVTVPATGKVSFTPTSLNTAAAGTFYYDVQRTAGSQVRTLVKDSFIIQQDISK